MTDLVKRLRTQGAGEDGYRTVFNGLLIEAASALESLSAENAAMKAALTPSAETKADYIGEFSFFIDTLRYDDDGEEVFIAERVLVPWDTVKEIMKAIHAAAIRNLSKES